MVRLRSILFIWVIAVSAFGLSLWLIPNGGLAIATFISYCLQLLLFMLSVAVVRNEPTRKNKYIFLNFSFFFSISIFFHAYNFIEEPFTRFYFSQYVSMAAYFFLLTFAIVYLAIDALFRDFKTLHKYVITLGIVGTTFGVYYSPYLQNAKYLYTTRDAIDFVVLRKVADDFRGVTGHDITPEVLSSNVELHTWRDGKAVGTLFPTERSARVEELYPYLHGSNYIILLQKPLYMNSIYMSVMCVGFVLLFFGYQYLKDPPQGAYIEKIMFLLLIFCTMEILHAWSFVNSVEWQVFSDIFSLGQSLSGIVLFFIAIFFSLRLNFITSVKGEFYEQELSASPAQVTRWRDALDNMVIDNFFNRKTLLGRLFVDPNHR